MGGKKCLARLHSYEQCTNMLADSEVAYQVSEVQGLSPHPLPAVAARTGVPTGRRSQER